MHGHVHGLYTTRPTWPVHDCVHAPFPRSVYVYGTCTRSVEHGHVYGRYTSVYTTVHKDGRVLGRVRAVQLVEGY